MQIFNVKNFFLIILFFIFGISGVFAEYSNTASTTMSIAVPAYLKIESVTSPVLIANITDDSGDLYSPLSTLFKVISNNNESKKLYLSALINTENGRESAMFQSGGRVYIAFGNLLHLPTSQSLANCKYGGAPKESPGVVAYPITSINGSRAKYIKGKEKYEMNVNSGITYITVNVGQHILRRSYAKNDPRGAYQAILTLTESDL